MMYVDESGDVGLQNSPTRYFVLTGVVMHELRWQTYLDQILEFRKRMNASFDLKMRDEIHAAKFISDPGPLKRIKRNDRLAILRYFTAELASMQDLNVINIVIDKDGKPSNYDVFENAWTYLIQRFEMTMSHNNFNGPRNADERGMIFPDHTDDKKLERLLRKMHRWNPTPSNFSGYRNLRLSKVIEDPNFRESHRSHFVQAADLSAFLLYQYYAPSGYIRKKGAQNLFKQLDPVLCKKASRFNPYGIVKY